MSKNEFAKHVKLLDAIYDYEVRFYGLQHALSQYTKRFNELVDLFTK